MKNWKFALLGSTALAIAPAASSAAFTDYTGLDGGGWSVDYQYHIQNGQNFSGGVPYDTNNSGSIVPGSYDRVAYVLEVQSGAGPDQYVFASFDPQSAVASLLGVPNITSGEFYQQNVNNLHVLASAGAPVTTGVFTGPSGNLEFWPSDYGTTNTAAVPGASDAVYDTGDQPFGGNGYGSMQIHNHNTGGANEVLIAFNQWNGGGGELGIGNQVGGSGHPDWTFSGNAGSYTIKDLQVLVHVPEPASLTLLGLATSGLIIRRRRA